MKTYDAIIYVTTSIAITIEAEDDENALEIIEDNISQGLYDDDIAESVGSYDETHSVDLHRVDLIEIEC